MTFDVVISNPPYNDDIYIDFIRNFLEITNKYICAITPAKWQSKTDKNNNNEWFRRTVVSHISNIVWYTQCRDEFEIYIPGGLTYYLIDKEKEHKVKKIKNICTNNNAFSKQEEEIIPKEGQYCYNSKLLSIINKCSGTSIEGRTLIKKNMYINQPNHGGESGNIQVIDGEKAEGYVYESSLNTSLHLDKFKVTSHIMIGVSDAYFDENGSTIGCKTNIVKPNQIPGYNFPVLGVFDTDREAKNYKGYLDTKFCIFLRYLGLCSNTLSKEFFRFIPDQMDYTIIYEDEPLDNCKPDPETGEYTDKNGNKRCSLNIKYKLTPDEQKIINNTVRSRKRPII